MKNCLITGCTKPKRTKKMCNAHYERLRLKGDVGENIPLRHQEMHGMESSPEYTSWAKAKNRCMNSTDDAYEHYGGRGITMCDRWKASFSAFFEDMGERPDGTSLDRINVDGNYEPSNCRWADRSLQSFNRRRTKMVGIKAAGSKYRATIKKNRKSIHLGTFNTLEHAIRARKMAERKYFGEVLPC